MEVKVWKENSDITLPKYGKEGDACMDIYAVGIETKDDKVIVHTGLHFELPEGYDMEIRPRSSNTKTEWYIPNSPCTLDEGYRGELMIIFRCRTAASVVNKINEIINKEHILVEPLSKPNFPYAVGDRICQLRISKRTPITWSEVESLEDLSTTARGAGAFGSTGGAEINKKVIKTKKAKNNE